MKVGFTGTRLAPTDSQLDRVRRALVALGATELHHGDCEGSDSAAHDIARELGLRIVVHPPQASLLRAYRSGDVIAPVKPYLDRNRDIVDETEWLIATPDGPERKRSGTWSTIRYARSIGRNVSVMMP